MWHDAGWHDASWRDRAATPVRRQRSSQSAAARACINAALARTSASMTACSTAARSVVTRSGCPRVPDQRPWGRAGPRSGVVATGPAGCGSAAGRGAAGERVLPSGQQHHLPTRTAAQGRAPDDRAAVVDRAGDRPACPAVLRRTPRGPRLCRHSTGVTPSPGARRRHACRRWPLLAHPPGAARPAGRPDRPAAHRRPSAGRHGDGIDLPAGRRRRPDCGRSHPGPRVDDTATPWLQRRTAGHWLTPGCCKPGPRGGLTGGLEDLRRRRWP